MAKPKVLLLGEIEQYVPQYRTSHRSFSSIYR